MKWGMTRSALGYAIKQTRGTFFAFIIGMSAANLVSMVFETRSISNLWGLTAKKTIISKSTFSLLEWVASLTIGFVAFEITNRLWQKNLGVYAARLHLFVQKSGLMQRLEMTAPRTAHSIRALVGSFSNSMASPKGKDGAGNEGSEASP